MRGRHIFGPGSKLHKRCFEWSVHRNRALCGQPEYQISEFLLNGEFGLRRMKKRLRASSPNALWNRLFEDINEVEDVNLSAPNRGAMLCGFNDPALADLMVEHSSSCTPISSRKDLDAMSDRYQWSVANAANKAFNQAMDSVCRDDRAKSFKALLRSAAFNAEFCDVDSGYDDILDLPFMKGMVQVHSTAPRASRRGILALIAPYFPANVVMDLFGVSAYEVTAAKLQDANAMAGQPLAKQTFQRMRLGGRTFAFLHQ